MPLNELPVWFRNPLWTGPVAVGLVFLQRNEHHQEVLSLDGRVSIIEQISERFCTDGSSPQVLTF